MNVNVKRIYVYSNVDILNITWYLCGFCHLQDVFDVQLGAGRKYWV